MGWECFLKYYLYRRLFFLIEWSWSIMQKKLLCKMINYQEFFSKTKNTSPYIETTSEAALKEFYAMLVGGAQQSFHGS